MATWEVGALVAAVTLLLAVHAHADRPQQLALLDEPMLVVRMPDGSLSGWLSHSVDGKPVAATRTSTDNGHTWSEPQAAFSLPEGPGAWSGPEPLLDRNGELHVFLLRYGRPGNAAGPEPEGVLAAKYQGSRLDIWYTRSHDGRQRFDVPRMIWRGYTGALNSVIQMDNGRILLPFSCMTGRTWANRGTGLGAWTFYGQFDCTLIYSDDAGATWSATETLSTPVPDIVSAYGAVEPVVLQLRDGRVWMILRTQQGRPYESFSSDGVEWTPPEPMDLLSSDSPMGIARLEDGRLVMLWNNCLRFPYAYGGRHVIHAAVSEDEGRTWRGFREVARDPRRFEPPPPDGDFGTAYPFPTVVNDGKVLYCTGQGAGRVLLMSLDPDWLLERRETADFAQRPEEWHSFGTRGVEIIPHPERPDERALHVAKTDPDWPGGVTWNFPAGRSGSLRLRIMARPGAGPLLVGITDHFSVPFDTEDLFNNLYNLRLGPGGVGLTEGKWQELVLTWSEAKRECLVALDGAVVAQMPLRRETLGACYLRLRSLAQTTDPAGYLVAGAEAEVE